MTEQSLFSEDVGRCDSPRLKWIAKHNIKVHFSKAIEPGFQPYTASFEDEPWIVINEQGDYCVGFGETEDEAIADLAIKTRTPLWNEEQ